MQLTSILSLFSNWQETFNKKVKGLTLLGRERNKQKFLNLMPEHRLKKKLGIFQLCGERGIPNERIKGMEVLDSVVSTENYT